MWSSYWGGGTACWERRADARADEPEMDALVNPESALLTAGRFNTPHGQCQFDRWGAWWPFRAAQACDAGPRMWHKDGNAADTQDDDHCRDMQKQEQ